MNNQTGGLKLMNTDKQGFLPVYDMIIARDSTVSFLTGEAASGIIYKLDVSQTSSEYKALNNLNFDTPVTNYVLKFVLLTETRQTRPVLVQGDPPKITETIDSFYEEAKLQQYIWERSIMSGPELSASVANFALFRNAEARHLLELLKGKLVKNSTAVSNILEFLHGLVSNLIQLGNKSAIDYMIECIKTEQYIGVGVLTMPAITQSTPYSKFESSPDNTLFYGIVINDDIKRRTSAKIFAQVIRLFLFIGILHFDLHADNVLVSVAPSPSLDIKTTIIDFGKASDITSRRGDSYLNIESKIRALDQQQKLLEMYKLLETSDDNRKQEEFIKTAMDSISKLSKYQLHIWNAMRDRVTNTELLFTFNALIETTRTNAQHVSHDEIQTFHNVGKFLNFDNPVSSFFVNPSIIKPITNSIDDTIDINAVLGIGFRGGKRNKKGRTKKHNKK